MKDRSRPIYQPWSEADLNMDEDYQSLGYIEKWMYRTLCQKAFVCSTRPYLPDDDSVLWKLSGSPSRAYWDEHKKTVRGMFRAFAAEGTTVLSRTRLVEDWERIQRIRRVKSSNASGGGRQEQAEQSTSNG